METKNTVATPGKSAGPVASAPAVAVADQFAGLEEILGTSKSRSNGGAKVRPNVVYTLVAANFGKLQGQNVPEQESVILKIVKQALIAPDARKHEGEVVVDEPTLKRMVEAAKASGSLKTKQDAWHIFRYYRTDLKKRGVLREISLPLPVAA